MKSQPKLVIVSDWIRRDLHEPLRHFKEFKIVHLYRQAGYKDMKAEDFENPKAIQWLGMFDLWHKIVAAKPDILQGGEPWANRSSLLITFVSWWYKKTHPRVRLIWPSMENRPIKEKFSWPIDWLLKLWTRVYGRSSDLVMYLNAGARKNLIEAGVSESKMKKVMWATWGVDCSEFSPQSSYTSHTSDVSRPNTTSDVMERSTTSDVVLGPRRTSDVKNRPKTILFVGKVSEAKGVPWLIEAFEMVHRQLPDTNLVLAGPMDKNSKFEFLNSKQIQNPNAPNPKGLKNLKFVSDLGFRNLDLGGVDYLGIIKNKDLPDLLRQAAVVVAPSITTKTWAEQVGMVNLQAMACGVPVVTTQSGAIPEFVKDGEGAILVPEKDSQAIADMLIRLLTDSKLHSSISQKARQYICGHYEVKQNIIKVEKLLLHILTLP